MTTTPPHVQRILGCLQKVKATPKGWSACCPAHDDKNPSLSVDLGDDGRVLLCCHAGCPREVILSAIGLEMKNLFPPREEGKGRAPKAAPTRIEATYDYVDAGGTLLFQVLRYEGKKFLQRRPDPERPGQWIWSLDGTPRPLYRLPELRKADNSAWIFICEGEKDVDNVRALGLTATCNSGGALKWSTLSDDSALYGRRVCIIPDRDATGERHMRDVATRLHGKAAEVRILDLGTVEGFNGKDVSDWIGTLDGKESEEIRAALLDMAESAPVWTPEAEPVETDGADWPELLPLREAVDDPPEFPLRPLPVWLRDMVVTVSETTQTPPDLAGSVALAILALCGGGKVMVEVRPGWREPLNMYLGDAEPPASRKSAVFRLMVAVVLEWEKRERERLAPEITKAATERAILEQRLNGLKKKAADGDYKAAQEAEKVSFELAAKIVPPYPRLFTGDATPEAIARLLAEQGGRLGIFSAEAGEIMAIMRGRYDRNGESNLEIFLKGHAGDAIRIDRANREREPVIIDTPALTICAVLQPSVLESAWGNSEFASRGLLARFLVSLPKSPLGSRRVDPLPVPESIQQAYERAVMALLNMLYTGEPQILSLAPDAWALLKEFMEALEPKLGPEGQYRDMADWAGKLAGAVVRMAGLLHLAGDPFDIAPSKRAISADAMRGALELGTFYLAHAERIYRMFGGTPEARMAARIADWLKRNRVAEFSAGELYRNFGLRKAEASGALALLEETGHIRRAADTECRNRPGRKRIVYEVNPALLVIKSKKSKKSAGGEMIFEGGNNAE